MVLEGPEKRDDTNTQDLFFKKSTVEKTLYMPPWNGMELMKKVEKPFQEEKPSIKVAVIESRMTSTILY